MIKRIVNDLGVLASGLAATVGVALGIGFLMIPRLDAEGLPSPNRLSGTSAVLVVRGDIEGRYILDRPIQGSVGDTQGGAAEVIDIGVVYSGSSATLAITAHDAGVGGGISGEALQVELILNGEAFPIGTDSCTVILETLRYIVLRPMPALAVGPPRGVPLPAFSGRIQCTSLQAPGSGRRVDISGVFRWEPDDGWV